MSAMTLEKLQVIIDAQIQPLQKELNKMRTEISNATKDVVSKTSRIKSAFSGMAKFLATLAIGATFIKIGKSSLNMAREVEASTQQVNRLMGESAQAFMRWGKASALAFNLSQSDVMNFGAVYGNLLTSFISSTSGVAKYTTELLKASSIIASGTGRTMEDVMERIRSGLLGNTEAIEDLGINVNVAMLESTDAFKRFAGDNSWNQLDFQTQQQIRLFAILEQTSKKFGDTVLSNTNASLAQLTAIIKDIALNIGNALLPILNAVLPIFINVAMAVRTATSYLASFMSLLFGKKINGGKSVIGDTANSIKGATSAQDDYNNSLANTGEQAKKTAKEMNALMGFDQINKLSDDSDSSSGSGSTGSGGGISSDFGGLDFSDAFPEEDLSHIQKQVDKVKKIFNDLASFLKKHKAVITSILAGIVAGFLTFEVLKNWPALVGGVVKVFSELKTITGLLGLALSEATGPLSFLTALFGTTTGVALAVAAVIAVITAALVYLYQTSESFRNLVNESITLFVGILTNLWQNVLVPLGTLLFDIFNTIVVPLAVFIAEVVVKAVEAVATIALSFWQNILAPIANFLVDILAIALQGVIDVWLAWKPKIELIYGVIKTIWDNMLSPLVDWIVSVFIKVFENWGEVIKRLIPNVKQIFQGLVNFLVGVFTFDIKKVWQGITQIFQGFGNFLNTIFTTDWSKSFGLVGGIINGLLANAKNTFNSLKQVFNGIIDFIKGVFTGNWSQAWNGLKNILSGVVGTFTGIFKGPLNAIIGLVNGAIGGLNSISVTIPKWVPGFGGQHFGISLPKIPYLARGGIVDSATLAMIGEAGTEAVVPLENNTRGLDLLANKLLQRMSSSQNGNTQQGGDLYITLVLETGEILIRKIIKDYNSYIRARNGEGGFIF